MQIKHSVTVSTSRPLLLALGVFGLALAQSAPSIAAELQFPSAGVLCDPGASICYDQRGASIPLTRRYLGSNAAQRLRLKLAGGPAQQQFQMTNGATCSLTDRRCWKPREIDPALTNRLFKTNAGGALTTSSSAAVNFPAVGVLCDPGSSICYDQRGASIPLTQTFLGSIAAQQLSRSLAGRPSQPQFVLSNGAYCNLVDRRCWSDGWSRRRLDTVLSDRLFITEATNDQNNANQENGLCTLSQNGAALFSGACSLRQVNQNGSTRYVVRLNNGLTYNFSNRSGQFQLVDSYGTWPVTISNQGDTGLFRWRDVQLSTTRQGVEFMPNGGSIINNGTNSGINGVIDLIQSLFR